MNLIQAMKILERMLRKKKLPNDDYRIMAYNTVAKYLLNNREEHIEKNNLEFKLFVHCYNLHLRIQGLSFLDDVPQKEFLKSIDKPIKFIINDFCRNLNDLTQLEILEDLELSKKHPAQLNKDESNKEMQIMQLAMNDPLMRKMILGIYWENDKIHNIIKDHFLAFKDVCNI